MTTHPHGTKLAYLHNPCRCRPCTTAWNVYQQKLKLRHARGQVWADPDDYRDVLTDLLDRWGASPTAIYRATGVKWDQVTRLHEGGNVHVEVASRLDGLTIDDLDDGTKVSADRAREILDKLEGTGVSRHRIATSLGWGSWPSADYPTSRKVTLGLVRRLGALLDDVTRPRCETCGGDPMPGGARQCADCFARGSWPSRSEMDLISRREQDAARKRAQRAARRRKVAA